MKSLIKVASTTRNFLLHLQFKIRLFQANYLGMYKYNGIIGYSNMPKAKVLYPFALSNKIQLSIPMEFGTAVSYARMFNGIVVPVNYKNDS